MAAAHRIHPTPATGALAQHFLEDELPEGLAPTEAEHQLQVAVIWGGNQVVEVADAKPGKPFTIGPRDVSLQMFHNLPGSGPLPLVTWDQQGRAVVILPRDSQATVRSDGVDFAASELIASGCAERVDVPVLGARYTLGLHDRAILSFGSLRLVVRFTRPNKAQRRPLVERIDSHFLSLLVVLAMVAGTVARMVAISPDPEPMSDDTLRKIADHITLHAPPVPPRPSRSSSGEKANASEGRLGRRDRPPQDAAPSKPHHSSPDDDHEAVAHAMDMFNALRNESEVLGPAGVDGLNVALEGITPGATASIAGGSDGLGVKGDDRGGGGHSMDIGFGLHGYRHGNGPGDYGLCTGPNCIAKKTVAPPSISHEEDDPGYRDVIERTVRRHWNEIKYCYEKELDKNPNLEGKVGTFFVIGGNGQVIHTAVREDSLGSTAAESCILNVVSRMQFPAPKIKLVEVNYPFIFAHAE